MSRTGEPTEEIRVFRSGVAFGEKTDEGVGVRDDALAGDILFNPREFDPFGWSIGERVRFGSITAGSVGFLVLKIEVPKQNPDTELIYHRQELVEFSICNVPANPYALADTSHSVAIRFIQKGKFA